MIGNSTELYPKEDKYKWEYMRNMFQYTYNAKSDDVTIHEVELFRRRRFTSHDITFAAVRGMPYEYGTRIANSDYPATASIVEAKVYRNTFWLAERDDTKAYEIIKALKHNQSKEYVKEVINFSELEERYER